MSIGYEDVTVHHARTGRAPLHETVTFVGPADRESNDRPDLMAAERVTEDVS